jgi:hypothetical protein
MFARNTHGDNLVKVHGAHMVLVIIDKFYGLIFMLSYTYIEYSYIINAWRSYVDYKVERIRRKWKRLIDDQCVIQEVIQRVVLRELSLSQLCLEKEDWMNIRIYPQYIIIIKKIEMIWDWSRQNAKNEFKFFPWWKIGFKLITTQSIHVTK